MDRAQRVRNMMGRSMDSDLHLEHAQLRLVQWRVGDTELEQL